MGSCLTVAVACAKVSRDRSLRGTSDLAGCFPSMTVATGLFKRLITTRKGALLVCTLVAIGAAIAGAPLLRTEYALAQARRCLNARNAERALDHLRTAERLDPMRAETQFLLARAYRRLGRMDEVHAHLLLATRSGWPREQVRREEWLALAQSGQLAEAEPHLGELLRTQQGDGAEICEAFVEGYFAAYRFDRALVLLEAWKTDYPPDPRPHVYLGLYNEHFQRWSDAAEAYREAVTIAPEDGDIRLRLASVLMRLYEYDRAEEHFHICLEQRPDDLDVLCQWGACLRRQARTEEARTVLEQVMRKDPRHLAGRLAMGQLEQATGNSEAARQWLEPLCRETPTDIEARYTLAQALQVTGQTAAAQQHFAFVLEAQEQMREVDNLTDLARTRPDDTELRFQIGTRLLKYDNPSHGAAWLRSVLDLNPAHQGAHAALAGYYVSIGNTELAERHRRQVEGPDTSE